MCHRIAIDKENKLAQVIAGGKVDVLELKEIFTQTVVAADWRSGFNMLCDYSRIEDFDVSTGDIDDLAEWLDSMDELIGSGRCAVVAGKDSVFGMNRMWQMVSSGRSQQISIFRQMTDAVSWLND
jgi:hypothetical protein